MYNQVTLQSADDEVVGVDGGLLSVEHQLPLDWLDAELRCCRDEER